MVTRFGTRTTQNLEPNKDRSCAEALGRKPFLAILLGPEHLSEVKRKGKKTDFLFEEPHWTMSRSTSRDLIDLLALGRAGGSLAMGKEVGSGGGGVTTCWQAIDSRSQLWLPSEP